MDTLVSIRPYRPSDRRQVREICYLTGYMGEPVDWFWRDLDSFANIWSAYYTDQEPESLFVAIRSGRVVGYLFGCIDTARSPSLASTLTRQVICRFLFFRRGTAGFFRRSIRDVLRGTAFPPGELDDARWPSHLHINLLPKARGAGAGAALMHAWFGRLATMDSPGCHLATLAENKDALSFFERMGFRRHDSPLPIPGMRTRDGAPMHQQFMVREITDVETDPPGGD